MATRHALVLAVGFALSSSPAFVPAPARAADKGGVPQGHVDNAEFQFQGKANRTVFVRSGPSNNFYPTMKLDKGAEVTVVGIKYQWLKILPPAGSFSYVPKHYIEARGTGNIGRVTNKLNVRAGSTEVMLKTTVQTELVEGQDVSILGEQDEYWKIVPPEGAYLFVHKEYVDPIGPGVKADPGGVVADAKPATPVREAVAEAPVNAGPADAPEADAPDAGDADEVQVTTADPATPDTRPARRDAAVAGGAPAAKPAATPAGDEFRKLEADFEAASKQPVVDQPIEQLTERYAKLVKAGTLTGSTKRMADARLMVLGMRADAREQLQAFHKSQTELAERRREFETEKQEIDEQIERTKVTVYAAVGVLRVSSLQRGDATLFRLTDPATGRTVAYVRSNDPKIPGLLNQFVGVRGGVTTDARLNMKILTPTETEAVDPSKVNATVIATITPPSMITVVAGDNGEAAVAE